MSPIISAAPARRRQMNGGTGGNGSPEQLIKSHDRVKAHGEVFTPRHMVDKMLDIACVDLDQGPAFVDTTFFEPAAGDGNFLLAILQRKLTAVSTLLAPEAWPTESLFALASIYGIELLEDNHAAAQQALLEEFTAFHAGSGVACNYRTNLWRAAKHLIEANILQGNTLTGQTAAGKDIMFSWWNRVPRTHGIVQRTPFTLASLRDADTGTFDFTTYTSYAPCRIDQVHKEVSADDQS